MPIDDSDYVAAWKSGGSSAVETLLTSRCADMDARIRELELLEILGSWDIRWHRSFQTGKVNFGVIRDHHQAKTILLERSS